MRVMTQKGRNPRKTLPTREVQRRGERRNEKEERECEKNKQTQAVISVQTIKRKSHRKRKTIPLNDRVDESLGCEERMQRELREEGEQSEEMGQ